MSRTSDEQAVRAALAAASERGETMVAYIGRGKVEYWLDDIEGENAHLSHPGGSIVVPLRRVTIPKPPTPRPTGYPPRPLTKRTVVVIGDGCMCPYCGPMTRTELGYAAWKYDPKAVAAARVQAQGRISMRALRRDLAEAWAETVLGWVSKR